ARTRPYNARAGDRRGAAGDRRHARTARPDRRNGPARERAEDPPAAAVRARARGPAARRARRVPHGSRRGMSGAAPSQQAYAGAARAALGRWDLDAADLVLVAHRENAVFKVHARDASYALRVHRPGYHDDAALESELAWVRALSEDGVEVPAIVPASGGELFVTIRADGIAGPVRVDLFEWIDGEPLAVGARHGKAADPGWVHDQWGRLGALAAALHAHAAGWRPPAGFVRHAWDEHGLAGREPLWGRFWELPSL